MLDRWKFILSLWKVSVWTHSQTDNFLYCQDTKFYQRILFQNSCIFELINDTPGDLWQFKVLWQPLYACYRLKSIMIYFQRAAFSAFRYAPKVEWMEIDLDLFVTMWGLFQKHTIFFFAKITKFHHQVLIQNFWHFYWINWTNAPSGFCQSKS